MYVCVYVVVAVVVVVGGGGGGGALTCERHAVGKPEANTHTSQPTA
jgi:hypothetical protein